MLLAVAIAIAIAALGGTPAYAEPTRRSTPITYDFEDTQVLGDDPSCTVQVLQVRRGGDRESLIRVREQFLLELYKSVEAL